MLDVALQHGWKPRGTRYPDATLSKESKHPIAWEPLAYFVPCGQSIEGPDAREMARCSMEALDSVSDTEVALGGKSFSEEHTLSLLRLAHGGKGVPETCAEAAFEVLSGPPKQEAMTVVRFLREGHVHILPEDRAIASFE